MPNAIQISNWIRINNHIYYHPEDISINTAGRVKPVHLSSIHNLNHFLYCVQGLYLAIYNQKAFPDLIKKGWSHIYLPSINHKYKHSLENIAFDAYHAILEMNQNFNKQDLINYKQVENNHKLSLVLHVLVNQFITHGDGNDNLENTISNLNSNLLDTQPIERTKPYQIVHTKLIQLDFQKRVANYEFHHVLYPYLHQLK